MRKFPPFSLLLILALLPISPRTIAQSTDLSLPRTREEVEACDDSTPTFSRRVQDCVDLGIRLSNGQAFELAIAAFDEAIALIEREFPNCTEQNCVNAYYRKGITLANQRQWEAAIAPLRRAIDLNPNFAPPYVGLGDVQTALDNPDEARIAYEQAIDLYEQLGEPDDWIKAGDLSLEIGDLEAAIHDYQQAIELFEADSHQEGWLSPPNLVRAYIQSGNVRRNLAERLDTTQPAEALRLREQAVEDYANAIARSNEAIDKIRPENPSYEVRVENRRIAYSQHCSLLTELGRPEAAQPSCDEAIQPMDGLDTAEEFLREGDRISQHSWSRAIQYYNRAIELDQTLAIAYNNRGVAYANSSQWDEAIADYQSAFELDSGNPTHFVNLLNALRLRSIWQGERWNLADISQYLEKFEASVLDVLDLLPVRIEGDLLAAILSNQRDYSGYRDRTYSLATRRGYYDLYIYFLMYRHQLEQLSQLADDGVANSYSDMEAFRFSERAHARTLLETVSISNPYQPDRQSGDYPNQNPLLSCESSLKSRFKELKQIWEELDFVSTTDFDAQAIATKISTIQPLSMACSASEIDPIEDIQLDQIEQLDQEAIAPQDYKFILEQRMRGLLDQIKDVRQKYCDTVDEQYCVSVDQPPDMTVETIQAEILDSKTLLLEYWLGEKASYLWAISKPGVISETGFLSFCLEGACPGNYEASEKIDIAEKAKAFYDHLTNPNLRVRPHATFKAGMELSQEVLGPIAEVLNRHEFDQIVVVPDGILNYIPFSALPMPRTEEINWDNPPFDWDDLPEPLLDKQVIVNLPSASVLYAIRQRSDHRLSAPQQIALVIDSNLRESGQFIEADEILDEVGDEELIFSEMTEFNDRMKELRRYQIIHFATHGILNDTNPEESGLVLFQLDAENRLVERGFLRIADVFNFNLGAELVVLSGCRTGLGENIRGEGLLGLAQGFISAGAERVMVSLWSVDDQVTADLMEYFYENLLEDDLLNMEDPPAIALAKAQRSIKNKLVNEENVSPWETPYYWAAFVLQGDWREFDVD